MKTCITIDMDNYRDYQSLLDPGDSTDGVSFYLDAIPRFLDIFDAAGAKVTFFMVGRDARVEAHRRIVREIFDRGHEVGNHSYTHPYNFRALSHEQRENEVSQGEHAIADILGDRPVGFRAPSCEVDLELLRLLDERGYLYDSSVFPSPIMWAFMLYGKLFVRRDGYQLGHFKSVFAPRVPYDPSPDRVHRRRRAGDERSLSILEIPFSVLPIVRVPFYSTLLRRFGPRMFERMVAAYGRRSSILHVVFHIIELAEFDDTALGAAYRRAPGLAVPFDRRMHFIGSVVDCLCATGDAVTLREFTEAYRAGAVREAA